MAKAHQKIQGKAIATREGQGTSFEQEASYDDTLLPDALELQRLQALDPTIMDWIKARTEREQDMRHEFSRHKMKLVDRGQRMAVRVDVLTIFCAFFIMMAGMGLSAFLLYSSRVLEGSIFAGATLFFAAKAFLNFRKGDPKPDKKK